MSELGESVAAGTAQDNKFKPYKFAAHIVTLTFVDSELVTLAGAKVSAPHWTFAGKDNITQDWSRQAKRINVAPRSYSKKPAAYTLPGGRKVKLEIEVTESENVSGSGKVEGIYGDLLIKGMCPTSVGKHTVDATITGWTDTIDGIAGNVIWSIQLTDPEVAQSLGSTFVEVYLLLNKPAKMYGRGVPAEVLRFLVRKVGLRGKSTAPDVANTVTKYVHGSHGMTYDVVQGGTAYHVVPPNGAISDFAVVDYVLKLYETINCYDQAAAVQSLAGAVGVVVNWVYLRPYGFIQQTQLVGVKGVCNNPFYLGPNPADGAITNLPFIGSDDPRRSAFGNHAFCSLSSKILDACAGPHLGTESLQQYIDAAIDHTTKLNKRHPGLPGTAASAIFPPGIVSTNPTGSI